MDLKFEYDFQLIMVGFAMSIVLRDGAHRFVAMCKRNDYRASFYDFTPPQPFFHHGHFRVQHIDVVHVVSVGTGELLSAMLSRCHFECVTCRFRVPRQKGCLDSYLGRHHPDQDGDTDIMCVYMQSQFSAKLFFLMTV